MKNRTDGRNWSRAAPEVALFALTDCASRSDCRRFSRQSDRHLNDSHSPPLLSPPPSPHICFGIWVFFGRWEALLTCSVIMGCRAAKLAAFPSAVSPKRFSSLPGEVVK